MRRHPLPGVSLVADLLIAPSSKAVAPLDTRPCRDDVLRFFEQRKQAFVRTPGFEAFSEDMSEQKAALGAHFGVRSRLALQANRPRSSTHFSFRGP